MTACQRWLAGQQSWRDPAERFSFRPGDYQVSELTGPGCDTTAKTFVLAHHYLGTYPNAKQRYALTHRGTGQLVGMAVLAIPVNVKVLTGVFPHLVPNVESLELARFVLLDQVPANAESWFLAEVRRLAALDTPAVYAADGALLRPGRPGLRGLVADSDPLPRRRADGTTLTPGHIGIIYQASSARYCGRTTPGRIAVLPDGTVFSRRAMQKVRRGEQGWRYAEQQLTSRGARPRATGRDRAAWLAEALNRAGAVPVSHPGNHRYAFPVGPTARARRQVVIAPPGGPYPKPELTLC
jgi:hypothetical protein